MEHLWYTDLSRIEKCEKDNPWQWHIKVKEEIIDSMCNHRFYRPFQKLFQLWKEIGILDTQYKSLHSALKQLHKLEKLDQWWINTYIETLKDTYENEKIDQYYRAHKEALVRVNYAKTRRQKRITKKLMETWWWDIIKTVNFGSNT